MQHPITAKSSRPPPPGAYPLNSNPYTRYYTYQPSWFPYFPRGPPEIVEPHHTGFEQHQGWLSGQHPLLLHGMKQYFVVVACAAAWDCRWTVKGFVARASDEETKRRVMEKSMVMDVDMPRGCQWVYISRNNGAAWFSKLL